MGETRKNSDKSGGDKRTIGITLGNDRRLAGLIEAGRFGSELEAAKFAMAYAIRERIPATTAEGASTKWNVGTFDPDGSLRSVIESFYPGTTEPYRLVEQLVNEALQHLDAGDNLPPDVAGLLFGKADKPETSDNKHSG